MEDRGGDCRALGQSPTTPPVNGGRGGGVKPRRSGGEVVVGADDPTVSLRCRGHLPPGSMDRTESTYCCFNVVEDADM